MSLQTNGNLIDECITLANSLPDAVGSVEPTLQEKTVTPSTSTQTVTPDDGYDGLSQVTVDAMPTATQAKPSISVSSSGLITAKATQSAGYVSAGTKSATKQLTKQAAQTITPGTSNKTIASGRYLTGTQTIKGDANLVAENIKSGVSIFGVTGSYEGSGGGGASVETCTVTIDGTSYCCIQGVVATVVSDGVVETVYLSEGTEGYTGYPPPLVINNVVCNSYLCVKTASTNTYAVYNGEDETNMSVVEVFQKVPTQNNSSSSSYDDLLHVLKAPSAYGASGSVKINYVYGK